MTEKWDIKRLGDIVRLEYGKPLPDSKRKRDGKYPVYGANGEKNRTDEYYYNKKSIIVGRKGSAGEVNLTESKFWPLDVTFFVTFDEKVHDLKFLYYLLASLELPKLAKGVKPGINRNEVYDISLAIPSMPEQKRIVEILDETFAAIDKAAANIEKNLQNAKELFESRKLKAFASISHAEKVPVSKVCREIFAGGDSPKEHFSAVKTEKFNVPIIANAVENNGLYGFTNYARINEPSITIAARGSGTGHTEIRFESFLPIVRLIVMIPKADLIDLRFLMYSIQNLKIVRSGSAIPQLTVPMIKGYEINVPDINLQREIVAHLDGLKAQIEMIEFAYKQKLNALEVLKKSILKKAFTGELTSKSVAELI